MPQSDILIVFTRYPEPGKVKTRMIQVLGEQGAADLQCAMIQYTLDTAGRLAATDNITVEVHFESGSIEDMQSAFGRSYPYMRQEGYDLGERMLSSFFSVPANGSCSAVIIGTDCPGITEAVIRQAFYALKENDCVLGPSYDGGYYLIGLNRPVPELFTSIPWGTPEVLNRTLEAIDRLGLRAALLRRLTDIDRPEDLPIWEKYLLVRSRPMISAIIPALNESERIEGTIQSTLQGVNVEVVVVDGGSIDGTRELSARMGARVLCAGQGRAIQMNEGARNASGEILLFLHADTCLPRGYDEEIRNALDDKGAAAGAFSLGFDTDSIGMKLIALGANMRSRYLSLPYGDQGLFVRKDSFLQHGCFPEFPIMEDVSFIRTMKKWGRIETLPSKVITSSRRFITLGSLRAWMLNQFAMAGFFLGVPLEDLADLYRGREQSLGTWLKRLIEAAKNRAVQ
jgi:uncharacterized protein